MSTKQLKRCLLLVSFLLEAQLANAQFHKFTQVHNQPLLLNPAYTGSIEKSRVIMNSSRRWPGLSSGKQARFDTYTLSIDQFYPKQGIATGLLIGHDRSGSSNLLESNIGFIGVKEILIGKRSNQVNSILRFGLEFDYARMEIDFSDLIFEDQILTGKDTSQEELVGSVGRVNYFDFSFGSLFSMKNAWFGIALHHLNQPDISLIDQKTILPTKLTLHAGVSSAAVSPQNHYQIRLSSIYQRQSNIDQLSLGARVIYQPNPIGTSQSRASAKRDSKGEKATPVFGVNQLKVTSFSAGFWYNGISFAENLTFNSGKVDPFAFSMTLGFSNFSSLTYQYELPLFSTLNTSTGGAHEISLRFQLGYIIPCPKEDNYSWKDRAKFPIMRTR